MNRSDRDRTTVEMARTVMVVGPEPHRSTALRYLRAESRLSAADPECAAADVWGALVVDPAGLTHTDSDYPALSAVAVAPGLAVASEAEFIADGAVARLLHASRRAHEADALVRAGGWRPGDVPPALHGSTVTVVGVGEDAARTAQRLHALACDVTIVADAAAVASVSTTAAIGAAASHWIVLLPSSASIGVVPLVLANADGAGVIDARDLTGGPGAPHGVPEHSIRRAIRDLAAAAMNQHE